MLLSTPASELFFTVVELWSLADTGLDRGASSARSIDVGGGPLRQDFFALASAPIFEAALLFGWAILMKVA